MKKQIELSVVALIVLSLAGCHAVPKYRRLLHPQARYSKTDGHVLKMPKGVKVLGQDQRPIVSGVKIQDHELNLDALSKPPVKPLAILSVKPG